MTTSQKHIAIYGGAAIVVGLGVAYFMSGKQGSGSQAAFLQLGADGAIPNTYDFGADYTGQSASDFGSLGEPVADYGPGANIVLPVPYVPPVPTDAGTSRRRKCGCCPEDSNLTAAQVTANVAPLLNQMYHQTAISEWSY